MRQLVIILGLLLLTALVGMIGIHYTTDRPWFESLYLAVITLTTVGSENVPPPGNRLAMLFVMIYLACGLGIFSYGAFQLGQFLVNAHLRGAWEQRRMHSSIAHLSAHFVVCGQGRMGQSICEQLQDRGKPFVVIERDAARLEQVAHKRGWLFIVGDATNDEVLRSAGVERAAALATSLATDADNLYVTMSAHMLAPRLNIIARASDDAAILKLQRAGATRVISPIHSAGVRMARMMLNPQVEEFLEIADDRGAGLELVEIEVGPESTYVNQRLADTDLRTRGCMVVGMRRLGGKSIAAPSAQTRIEAGDSLFVFGPAAVVNAVVDRSSSSPS